jgi:uncharacterized OB-fold protein
MSIFPAPEITPLSEPYWKGLAQGRLLFQRCNRCGHAWLPPREECPQCLCADWAWQTASGRAKLISWGRFHIAYHPAFKDRVPYNVAVVELEEGPRLVSNLVGEGEPMVERKLRLVIEKKGELSLARFALV